MQRTLTTALLLLGMTPAEPSSKTHVAHQCECKCGCKRTIFEVGNDLCAGCFTNDHPAECPGCHEVTSIRDSGYCGFCEEAKKHQKAV